MTSRQESKITMYGGVSSVLGSNMPIVITLPNYEMYLNAFDGGVVKIQTNSEQQLMDTSGLAVNKEQKRNTLIMLTADTANKLQAYARFANNPLLIGETKITVTSLRKLADTLLRDKAQGICSLAQTNLASLAAYGINDETQAAFNNAINTYTGTIPQPRVGAVGRKQNTALINEGFDEADKALEDIDVLVEIVKYSQPVFYGTYKSVRKLIETGKGSLAVKGGVTEAADGTALANVIFTFTLTGTGAEATKPIVKKTAEKGGFTIKSLPAGTYQVAVQKPGYAGQLLTVIVVDGETSEVNVALEKG